MFILYSQVYLCQSKPILIYLLKINLKHDVKPKPGNIAVAVKY